MSIGVIVARQRSGTSALVAALGACDGVVNCGEVLFPPAEVWSRNHFFAWIESRSLKPKYPRDYSDYFSAYLDDLMQRPEIYILDMKINTLGAFSPDTWSSMWVPWTLDQVIKRSIPIVWLVRNNFATYVSAKHAEATSVWHRYSGQDVPEARIAIDKEEYQRQLEIWTLEDETIRRALSGSPSSVRVEYEELFFHGDLSPCQFDKIKEVFKINKAAAMHPLALSKLITKSLSEVIENYEEVRDLAGDQVNEEIASEVRRSNPAEKRDYATQFKPKQISPQTITTEQKNIGAPFSPIAQSFYVIDPRLNICQRLATAEEVQSLLAMRSVFRVADYPDPYVNDVLRSFRLLKGMQTYVEIGTFDRGNLAYVSGLLAPDALLIGIDIQRDEQRDELLRRHLKPNQRYESVTGSSFNPDTIATVRDILGSRSIDAIFIDGDHTAYSVMADYASYEQFVGPNGLFLFHDSVWEGDDHYKGVANALDEIDRVDTVFLIDGANPVRRFSRPLFRDSLWGVVGVVFASDQKWRQLLNVSGTGLDSPIE